MPKCWLILFENCAGVKGHGYISADTVGTIPGSCGVILIINGANTGIGERSAQWIDVGTAGYEIPAEFATNYGNECTPAPPPIKYDCLNGNCVPKSQYNTPGLYLSLEACEAACGGNSCPSPFECLEPANYCPPGKTCIPNSDWGKIESLSNQLKNKSCS